jgi:hypothetical protein
MDETSTPGGGDRPPADPFATPAEPPSAAAANVFALRPHPPAAGDWPEPDEPLRQAVQGIARWWRHAVDDIVANEMRAVTVRTQHVEDKVLRVEATAAEVRGELDDTRRRLQVAESTVGIAEQEARQASGELERTLGLQLAQDGRIARLDGELGERTARLVTLEHDLAHHALEIDRLRADLAALAPRLRLLTTLIAVALVAVIALAALTLWLGLGR